MRAALLSTKLSQPALHYEISQKTHQFGIIMKGWWGGWQCTQRQQTSYLFLFAGGPLSNSKILHLTVVLLPSTIYFLSTVMLLLITVTLRPQWLFFPFKHLYCNNQCTQSKFSKHNWCFRTEHPGNETCLHVKKQDLWQLRQLFRGEKQLFLTTLLSGCT